MPSHRHKSSDVLATALRRLIISWIVPPAMALLSWGAIDLVTAWHHKLIIGLLAVMIGPLLRCIAARTFLRAGHGVLLLILAIGECIVFGLAIVLVASLAPEGPALWMRWLLVGWCVLVCAEVFGITSITAGVGKAADDEFLPRAAPVCKGFAAAGCVITVAEALLWIPWLGPISVALGTAFMLITSGRAMAVTTQR